MLETGERGEERTHTYAVVPHKALKVIYGDELGFFEYSGGRLRVWDKVFGSWHKVSIITAR